MKMTATKTNNILVIDETHESSVSYHKSEISNTDNYKVSLSELLDIFKENQKDIYACDTSECFTILTPDNELNLYEFNKRRNAKKHIHPLFYKISTPELKSADCEILISSNYTYDLPLSTMQIMECFPCIFAGGPYIKDWKDAEIEAMKDIDGYSNTMKLYKCLQTDSMNTVRYCTSRQSKIGNFIYKGYMPSIKQMDIIYKCIDLLNYISNTSMPALFYGVWVTSTMLKQDNICFWALMDNAKFGITYKNNYAYVFPIYKRFVKNEKSKIE